MEIEESVIEKIKARREAGRTKYGVTMERTDLSRLAWLIHAQQEVLDYARMHVEAASLPLDHPLSIAVRDYYDAHPPNEDSKRPAIPEEYWQEISRLRTALVAARQHILERNGLDRDNDRRAAIAINIVLTPNND